MVDLPAALAAVLGKSCRDAARRSLIEVKPPSAADEADLNAVFRAGSPAPRYHRVTTAGIASDAPPIHF
jgi:hypothetical protein